MRSVQLALVCLIGLFFASSVPAQEPTRHAEQFFLELEQSLSAGALTLGPVLEELRVAAASGDAASQLLLGRYLMDGRRTATQITLGLGLLEMAAAAGLAEANYRVGEVYRNGAAGVRRQPARALGFYEAAAKAGDRSAARALAGLLLDQRYAFADRARGVELLESLAAEGDVQALLSLGGAYAATDGPAAVAALARAAVGGSTSALHNLGDLHRRGAPDLAADARKALQYFELLGRQGDQSARRKAADIYIRGEAGAPDIARAVAILRSVATAGDAQGLIALGDLYARGEFTPVDTENAIAAYRQAAETGLLDGFLRLGDLYRTGVVGMRANPEAATAVYLEAVSGKIRGHSSALTRLGDLFRTGADGVPPDGSRAAHYYEEAIALEDDGARRALAGMLLDGTLVPQDAARAVALLASAAERGDQGAAMQLGSLYGRGGPVQAEYDKAVQYYRLAADLGESSAPLRLAVALADGPLAAAHRQEGVSYLAEGVSRGVPGAVTELARLIVGGKLPGSQPTEARDMLYGAALGGDAGAARYLLQLYRDGAGGAFRPDLAMAERLLEEVSTVLGEPGATTERLAILARQGAAPETFDRIAEQFARLPRATAAQALERLADSNENAYIAQVQRQLAGLGLYDGSADGILTGATIEAFRRACDAAGALEKCDRGPLTGDAVKLMTAFLFTARPSED